MTSTGLGRAARSKVTNLARFVCSGKLRSAWASLWNMRRKSLSDMWRAACASYSGTLRANDSACGSLRSSMRLTTNTEPTPPLPSDRRT